MQLIDLAPENDLPISGFIAFDSSAYLRPVKLLTQAFEEVDELTVGTKDDDLLGLVRV